MKVVIAAVAALVVTAVATPAPAYVVLVTTSFPVPNTTEEGRIATALASAITDVLDHAVAFTPTFVQLESVRVFADRVYVLLLIADADGEANMEAFSSATRSSAEPTDEFRGTVPRPTY